MNKLINSVIEEIKSDIVKNDLTAIEGLLGNCPIEDLISFLPEDSCGDLNEIKKLNLIQKIKSILNIDYPQNGLLDVKLMYGEKLITDISYNGISLATLDSKTGEEIDWNDLELTQLDVNTLSDILTAIENYLVDIEKTYKRII